MRKRYSTVCSSVCLSVKVLDVNKLAYLWNFYISVDVLSVNHCYFVRYSDVLYAKLPCKNVRIIIIIIIVIFTIIFIIIQTFLQPSVGSLRPSFGSQPWGWEPLI